MRGFSLTRAFIALSTLAVTFGITQAQPVQLVFWDFSDSNTAYDSGVNGGTVALVGGTTATFATGSPLDGAATNVNESPIGGTEGVKIL